MRSSRADERPYRDEPVRPEERRVVLRSTLPPSPTRNFCALDFSDGSLVIQWLQPARIFGTRASVLGVAAGLAALIPSALLFSSVTSMLVVLPFILAGSAYEAWRAHGTEVLEVSPRALSWRENKPGGHGALFISEVDDIRVVQLALTYVVRVNSTSGRLDLFTRLVSDDEPLLESEAAWIVDRVREALGRARGGV